MTTLAYCAVSTDGQGAPGEIIVRDEAVPGLRIATTIEIPATSGRRGWRPRGCSRRKP